VPVGLDGDAISAPRVAGVHGNADGRAFEHAHEVAVARIAGVRQQDAVVAVHEQRHHEQQRGRRTGGDDDALGCDGHPIVIRIVRGDRAPQLGQAERRRVIDVAGGDRPLRGGDDERRRRKIRLADFHVHDGAAGRLQRARGRLHFHHVEGCDLRDAGRRADAGIHRKS
jgi:hypothetical protein